MTKRENLLRTIFHDRPGWVSYRYDGSLTLIDPLTKARPREGGLDDWGVSWLDTHSKEGSYPNEKPVLTLDQIDDFHPPKTDWEAVTEDLRLKIRAQTDQDTLMICRNEMVLFERAKSLLGTIECLVACAGDVERLQSLFDMITDYQIQLTRAMMRAGAAGVRFTDDWGMQNSLFVRPESWRVLVKSRLREIYKVVKEHRGLIFQHSCGHIEEIVADLIEIGVDVLDPCQPQSNDIFKWKNKYGHRLCFMGGLDTQGYLSFGTPEEVKSNVRQVISVMSQDGGYIAAPSHTISVPEKNRQAMEEAICEFNSKEMDLGV